MNTLGVAKEFEVVQSLRRDISLNVGEIEGMIGTRLALKINSNNDDAWEGVDRDEDTSDVVERKQTCSAVLNRCKQVDWSIRNVN